ncbi:MAG TPA: hypothetical protein VG347_11825 [Verrucomicrobiae bacterium]|nr:hypothetical protein [Verrucomicrobiae bacterium]
MKNNHTKQPVAAESLERKHEAQDPHLQSVGIVVTAVITMIISCLLATSIFVRLLSHKRPLHRMEALGIMTAPDQTPLTRFPQPNLQLDDGHASFTALNKQQQAKLNGYGWIDRPNNIVHIPIDRAIDLVLARGLTMGTNTPALNTSPPINSIP